MPTWTPPNLEFGLASNGTGKAANASLPSSLRLIGIVLSFYPRIACPRIARREPARISPPQHHAHAGADQSASRPRDAKIYRGPIPLDQAARSTVHPLAQIGPRPAPGMGSQPRANPTRIRPPAAPYTRW